MAADRYRHFDAVAERVCREAAGGGSIELADHDWHVLTNGLELIVRHQILGADPATTEDVIHDAVLRFLHAARAQRVDCARAGRYITQIASNAAIDVHRGRRVPAAPVHEVEDDVATARLEQVEYADAIVRALDDLLMDGHDTCFEVVTCWNDLARQPGVPSSRQVAAELGVSHTAVLDCLTRFQPYLKRHLPDQGPSP